MPSVCHIGGPVQERGTEPEARVTSADDDPPDVQRQLMAFMRRPDGLLVQGQWLFGIDGDRRDRGSVVPDDPGLALEQVIQYALSLPGPVRPGPRPLIGVLARPQPVSRLSNEPAYFVQVPRHSKAQSKRVPSHRYIVALVRLVRYHRERKKTRARSQPCCTYRASRPVGLAKYHPGKTLSVAGTLAFPDLGWVNSLPDEAWKPCPR